MKAVICSIDGVPREVACCNGDEEALAAILNGQGYIFDRVDIVHVCSLEELRQYVEEEAADLAEL